MWRFGLVLVLLLPGFGPGAPQVAAAYDSVSVALSSTTMGALQEIPATLLKPEGDGPFPAVAILHDCSGLGPRSSGSPARWGNILAADGYVVIIPDSFAPRGYPQGVCTVQDPDPQLRSVSPYARTFDAYAALAYLRTLAYVDGAHVGVMGGSHGGSATLATIATPHEPALAEQRRSGFAAAVALYPGCGARYGAWSVRREGGDRGPVTEYVGIFKPVAPLLILIGEKDDWTPAASCEAPSGSAATGAP